MAAKNKDQGTDVLINGQQQQQQQVRNNKTHNGKVPIGRSQTTVDVRFIGAVEAADGTGPSVYKKDGAIYGVNMFVLDKNKKLVRADFVMSKYLNNVINDDFNTVTIDGEEYFDFEEGDLVVKVFKDDEENWISPGDTEVGRELARKVEELRKASATSILKGATKS